MSLDRPILLIYLSNAGEGYAWKRLEIRELSPFDYTFNVDLILKLVAGLIAGLREYFLIVAGLVVIPCVVLLVIFIVGLLRPSRSKPTANPKG